MPRITAHGGATNAAVQTIPSVPLFVVEDEVKGTDYASLKRSELVSIAKELGIPFTGSKSTLVSRLGNHDELATIT